MRPTVNDIENLIRRRQTKEAVASMRAYLDGRRSHIVVRTQVADWYRRLGYPLQALRVLNTEIERNVSLNTPEGREQLTLCRILNSLGASRYAQRVLARIDTKHIPGDLCSVVGGIYLSNYRSSEALPLLERALEPLAKDPYRLALAKISLADCFNSMQKPKAAIKITRAVLAAEPEPLLKFITQTALGEYLVSSGDAAAALAVLEAARDFVKPEDRSNDVALWHKWMGAACTLSGDRPRAKKHLDQAFARLYQPRSKPEGWLEVLYWQGHLNKERNKTLPHEWLSFLAYPAARGQTFQKLVPLLGEDCVVIERHQFRNMDYATFSPGNQNFIDAVSNVSNVSRNRTDTTQLDTTLVTQLITLLSRAGTYGLPLFRLLEELWPHELFAFDALELRLKNLLVQARRQGFRIKLVKGHVSLTPDRSSPQVVYHPGGSCTGLGFLLSKQSSGFTRRDVEAAFAIKRSQAANLIAIWCENGLAKPSTTRSQYGVAEFKILFSLS